MTPIEKYHTLRKRLITTKSKDMLDDLWSELATLRMPKVLKVKEVKKFS